MQSNSNTVSQHYWIADPIDKRGESDNGTVLNNRQNTLPDMGVIFMALLAMLTVNLFRFGHTRHLPMMFVEAAVFAAIPLIAFCILSLKLKAKSELTFSTSSIIGLQLGALMISLLVVLWHIAIRRFGIGDSNELMALLTIQCAGWYLAVFSKLPGFEKASCVLNGALMFFVCCIGDDYKILLPATLFAFVGLWWLLGQYWSRLDAKAIDGDSRLLKLHGSAVSLTTLIVVAVACLGAAIPFTQEGISIAGFSPFSGGETGSQHEFAISGIGDGNMLTAGKNATTTGAVESDEFIEDHKQSLYDITSERYEGPIMKSPRNRAMALSAKAKHLHQVKQSEQAGRTFRTMRNTQTSTNLKLEDRITKALFFVEGSAPARFAINNFSHFDGWDWSVVPEDISPVNAPTIRLNIENDIPVFSIAQSVAKYLTAWRTHRVKIMRLKSKTIPASALLQKWHVPQVDNPNMFQWGDAGLIEIDGESIPTHTIIDLQSLVPNYHLLRESKNCQYIASTTNTQKETADPNPSHFLQVPKSISSSDVQTLADKWTAGAEPGWMQVESIVNHLRSDFNLNPNWETDEQAEDSVRHFFELNGGPSYMFATTCAMVLRSAGYKTRVVSGFLVQENDYDWRAKQSVVTADNLHMWPEVCLDGKFWIPVEPTPGYPIPYSTQTSSQWITAKAVMMWNWLLSNPLTVLSLVTSAALIIIFRAEWITTLLFGWWLLIRAFRPQSLLKTTRQLIDLRFWFSGDQRPASQTITAWYSRVESNATTTFCRLWNAENYSDQTNGASRQELAMTCRQTLSSLSLRRIKNSHVLASRPVSHNTKIQK